MKTRHSMIDIATTKKGVYGEWSTVKGSIQNDVKSTMVFFMGRLQDWKRSFLGFGDLCFAVLGWIDAQEGDLNRAQALPVCSSQEGHISGSYL